MPPAAPEFTGPKLPQGIPKELDTRLNHLSKLLQFLPTSLQLDPAEEDSAYCFYLDPDDVAEESKLYAFNRRLEIAFQTHKLCGAKLVFQERGKRLLQLVAFLRSILKECTLPEARNVQHRWIERLITAAEDSGAKIIHKTKKRHLDNNSDADDISQAVTRPTKIHKGSKTIDLTQESDEDIPPHSLPPSTALTKAPAKQAELQQRTLFQFGAKKLTATEAEAQRKRHAAESKERMLAVAEREKEAKARATERRRECGRQRQQQWRDRKKSSGESTSKKVKNAVLSDKRVAMPADLNIAEVSRPSGQKWKAERTGKKHGVIQRRHDSMNGSTGTIHFYGCPSPELRREWRFPRPCL
ncbi:hypothetical protein C8J57DRAFT_1543582 [Mycena rebaudengoi]|nr:hypothetical protein C8J57DRAFT_1543582 [Mycena rebaudengoi]